MVRRIVLSSFAVLSLFVLGCGSKIKFESSVAIDSGEVKQFFATAPAANHAVKLLVTSDNPVDVMVMMKSEFDKRDIDSLMNIKDNVLAMQKNVTTADIDLTIAAKEDFAVCIQPSNKSAKVTIKMNSQ